MTFENKQRIIPGTIALVGSGEYLPVMNEVDTYLLQTVGGVQPAHVALLPTASGKERMGPKTWNDLGFNHFTQLGVADVRPTQIIDHESANDPAQVALLEGIDFFYFSGGDPQYTIETLRDTLAWKSILAAYERGAVLAGCSAGAMMLGGHTISIRQVMMGKSANLVTALGIIPQLIIFPHFDRMAGFLTQKLFQHILRTIPSENTVIGIDEETALVRIALDVEGSGQDRWRVMGRQMVSVFGGDGSKRVFKGGEEVLL